jgi:hypothetical protein
MNSYKTLYHQILQRLLPGSSSDFRHLTCFFSLPVFTVTIIKKTDVSGYSGGTVTEFHRVPLAQATLNNYDKYLQNMGDQVNSPLKSFENFYF